MTEQFNTPDSILARLERLQASGKTALRPSPLSSEMILARLSGKDINDSDITASEKSGHPFHGNQWTSINYETHVTDQSDAVWNALQHGKEGISGIGCQRGGCLMVAKALQNNIGGNLKTVSVVYDNGHESDAHAMVEKEGKLVDSRGIQSEDEVKTYWKSWLDAKEIKIRDYQKGDLPYTPYNEEAVAKLTKTLRLKFSKQLNADKRTITASDVRREILRRKIEVIRAAAKDVSKEHRDADGKWASNPAGEPKGKIKHAVLIIDGKRYKGASHMSALMDWGMKNHKEGLPKVPERHQGFETESGHFLDREEAAEYGLKNNLVKEDADEAENTGKLRSEMLNLKATDGKLYAVETVTAEARTAEQDLAPELREHNRIRDEAEAPYRHAMARLIAAAELAKLKEKKAASKKKKEQEEAALIALWLLLMQDASQEAYANAGNALGGLLAVRPPAIPLTDAETPQIEPQSEIPPVTTEEAASYFERRRPLIRDIPNRVMERLDRAIDEGRSVGEDDRLLRLRLKREAQAIQSGYGEMVARNEAQATYTGAQIETLRKAGFATKIWVTMDDDKVRESHIDCGQQGEVPLDQPFVNGLMYPCEPDAPPEETCNCRCWLVGGRRIGEAVQATAHDVSGESRDESGKWSSGGGKKKTSSELKKYHVTWKTEFGKDWGNDEPIEVFSKSKSEAIKSVRDKQYQEAKGLGEGKVWFSAKEIEDSSVENPVHKKNQIKKATSKTPNYQYATGFGGEHLVIHPSGHSELFKSKEEALKFIEEMNKGVQATESQEPDSKVMSKGSLSVGRGEKLPISKGAGLTAKGRAKYNRAHGSNLKAPAPHPKTEKDAARRRSFCARMKGVVKHAKGDAPRAKASLKRWNCS